MDNVNTVTIATAVVMAMIAHRIWIGMYNYWLHPLARYPGPKLAATTEWYRTLQEVILKKSWSDLLVQIHRDYGEVARVGVNELHFANPEAYYDIHNYVNKWDKDPKIYHSFNEDSSSFGFVGYREAKDRKDVLAPLFSRQAISNLQWLVKDKMDRVCKALAANNTAGKPSNMLFGLRCFTIDTITAYCFAKDIGATEEPDFNAPIVIAMESALLFFPVLREFGLIKTMVYALPGWLTKIVTPKLRGLVDLQELLGAQVTEVVERPESLDTVPHPIVYSRLLDPALNEAAGVPGPRSLYDEAQALLFGGGESAANTLVVGLYHVVKNEAIYKKLKEEILTAWPEAKISPSLEKLEKLPYLDAVVKESFRMAPGVPAPLSRILPPSGAVIHGHSLPGGTGVGASALFVHFSKDIFADPEKFDPERWLGEDASSLEKYLIPFSRGPRSCLGQNLATAELYIGFASLFRRFDIELDAATDECMHYRDCFLPVFEKPLYAFCKPVEG